MRKSSRVHWASPSHGKQSRNGCRCCVIESPAHRWSGRASWHPCVGRSLGWQRMCGQPSTGKPAARRVAARRLNRLKMRTPSFGLSSPSSLLPARRILLADWRSWIDTIRTSSSSTFPNSARSSSILGQKPRRFPSSSGCLASAALLLLAFTWPTSSIGSSRLTSCPHPPSCMVATVSPLRTGQQRKRVHPQYLMLAPRQWLPCCTRSKSRAPAPPSTCLKAGVLGSWRCRAWCTSHRLP
mmetsp:Transcript_12159/g.35212  ORF Transcript_12159/g.35212 Transcript_12159/m.35212 type:complete len:240 (+) Transcript_12159:692-1411(+)